MTGSSGKAAKRAAGASILIGTAATAAGGLARVASHASRFGDDPVSAVVASMPSMPSAVTGAPLSIDWGHPWVAAAAAAGAALPLAAGLASASRGMRLANEDTGREHGDDRLATRSEMGGLMDRGCYYNNLFVSEHAGVALSPRNKRTKAALDGRNLNCVTLGISGLGKTYNLVKPDLMQAVGEALPPMRYGPGNIVRHLSLKLGGCRPVDWKESAERWRAGKKPRACMAEGFDVVNTDPKGDNVRDMGHMFEAAGYEVKVVNTVDFSEGLKVNPLAAIKTREVDVKPAEALEASASMRLSFGGAEESSVELDAVGGEISDRARADRDCSLSMRLETATTTGAGASRSEVEWMESEMGASVDSGGSRKAGSGCSKVAEAVGGLEYRTTVSRIDVEAANLSPREGRASVEIRLDEAMELVALDSVSAGEATYFPSQGPGEPGRVVWEIPSIAPRPRGKGALPEKLVLTCRTSSTRVPDGVALAKTVDCLVANLRGTDSAAAGSEDPFWEDAKRLMFMAVIAFLFERYDPRYRTLPEAMRLIDMALADSGNPADKSPLGALMDMWEYGRVYAPSPTATTGRGRARGGSWKPADTPPHSRNGSIAVHCYRAFASGAPETVQSVVISCQAALVNLVTPEVKELLSEDELDIGSLGDPDRKQAVFIVTKDTDSPFDFLTALIVYQAIDLLQDKAYRVYGGKLPRHVRFVLDEVANLGRIPILIRALAVVRSRNISISMFLQSKAQLSRVYGEKEADIIFDNCSTIVYLGAQTKETREEISQLIGSETVQTRTFQRSFSASSVASSTSESIGSNERRVMSASQLGRMEKGYLIALMFGRRPIYDHKFKTSRHPYYAYIDPGGRPPLCHPALFSERFDYRDYLRRHRGEGGAMG